jgi:membrane protease subunit (stomatin/prohibitin family)
MLFGRKWNRDGVIRFADGGRGLVIYRYGSDSRDLPLLPGSRIEVAAGQAIAFVVENALADVFDKGSYVLTPENFPMLAEKVAFRTRPIRPIQAELYFINMNPVTERKWATRSPALVRENGETYRVRAYGTYDFRVIDAIPFMLEVFRSRGFQTTYEIVSFLPTLIASAFAATVSELKMPVPEIVNHPWEISSLVCGKASQSAGELGLEITNVTIEGASLPDM